MYQDDGNRTQYLFNYVDRFSEIYFIINKLIAEKNIETAKLTLISQILYSKGYREEITEDEADELAKKLSQMTIFKLQTLYALEMRKLGVGPAIQYYNGSNYFDRVLKERLKQRQNNQQKTQ